MNMQQSSNKKYKNPNVAFLCNSFFFKCLSPIIFENHYYQHFLPMHFLRDAVIHNANTPLDKLFFIKNGLIKLEFTGSIMSMHNLIKDTIEKLQKRNKKITEMQIEELKQSLLDDPEILRIKNKDIFLKSEFNRNQTFDLFLLNEGEIIGVEEFYISVPYLTTSYVMVDNTEIFAISESDLKDFLLQEMEVRWKFERMATKKVITFIKRLHNVKRGLIKKILSQNSRINQEITEKLDKDGKIDMVSLMPIKRRKHRRNKTFTEIDVTSVEMKFTNEKLAKEKLLNDLTANRLNKQQQILNIQDNDNSKTIDATETNNKTNTYFKSIFSNSLVKQNVIPPIPRDFALRESTTDQFLSTKQLTKEKSKTIIKLRQGHFTTESIENEVNLINQQYIIIQNDNTKYTNKEKEMTCVEGTDYPNQCASSSHLSFVNLSNAKESVYSNGNTCLNYTYSRYLPEIKSTFNANQRGFMQNKIYKKIKGTNQEALKMKINNELIESHVCKQNLKYGNIAQRIKSYYNQKKMRGYLSIVNLENNKYGPLGIKKNCDDNKRNKKQGIKISRSSSVQPDMHRHIRAISQEYF